MVRFHSVSCSPTRLEITLLSLLFAPLLNNNDNIHIMAPTKKELSATKTKYGKVVEEVPLAATSYSLRIASKPAPVTAFFEKRAQESLLKKRESSNLIIIDSSCVTH